MNNKCNKLSNNMTIHSYRIAKKKIKHVVEAGEKTRVGWEQTT
jgi:hypothetical protein